MAAVHADMLLPMIRWVHGLQNGLGCLTKASCQLLFPPRCVHCGTDLLDHGDLGDLSLCAGCIAQLGPVTWHGCKRCGSGVLEDDGTGGDCAVCRDVALRFDRVIPLGHYYGDLRAAVLRMKRPAHDALSMALGRLLVQRRREELVELCADVIVPIPMFWGRRLGRGKNSPEALADCLARSLRIPVRRSVLVRCRNTPPQASLAPARRFQNVRGAFRVRRPETVLRTRVLLVDDVLTTGATCSEAAKMLKQAGAAMVAVAVVARTTGHLS
jgi:ComF family protein